MVSNVINSGSCAVFLTVQELYIGVIWDGMDWKDSHTVKIKLTTLHLKPPAKELWWEHGKNVQMEDGRDE